MIVPFALLIAAQSTQAAAASGAEQRPAMTTDCNARMLEIPVTVTSKGLPKQTRVKICGKVGQSDAEWLHTLKDALGKVEANPTMSPKVKQQIVAGLKLEIATLPGAEAVSRPVVPSAPEIAPAPLLTAPLAARPPVDSGRVEYSALPPMPAPMPVVSAAAIAAAPPPLPAPRLSFRCLSTNSIAGDGPCDLLERDTLVTVRADEDIPGGTSLRFLRRGDNRAEVDLGALRRGQSQRFSLPARICQGVTGSRVEIQVIRAVKSSTQVVDTRGPYELRC